MSLADANYPPTPPSDEDRERSERIQAAAEAVRARWRSRPWWYRLLHGWGADER